MRRAVFPLYFAFYATIPSPPASSVCNFIHLFVCLHFVCREQKQKLKKSAWKNIYRKSNCRNLLKLMSAVDCD